VPRRQFVFEPEVHRRDGWGASVWRVQHVRDGLEGGRERLFAAVHAGQVDRGKSELRSFSRERVGTPGDPLQNAKNRIAEHEHGDEAFESVGAEEGNMHEKDADNRAEEKRDGWSASGIHLRGAAEK